MAASLANFFKKNSWVYIENKLESDCQVESKVTYFSFFWLTDMPFRSGLPLFCFCCFFKFFCRASSRWFPPVYSIRTSGWVLEAKRYTHDFTYGSCWMCCCEVGCTKKENPASNLPSFSSGLWIFTERGTSHSLEMHALFSYIDEDLVKLAESIK